MSEPRSGVSTTKSPQPAPVTQAAAPAAAAISLELVQQLEAVARDLAVMRDSVEQLAAKQEQTTQNIATVAAKQEQMAQNIATLQAVEQDIRQRLSSPPLSEPVPLPPRKKAPICAQAVRRSASVCASPPRVPLTDTASSILRTPFSRLAGYGFHECDRALMAGHQRNRRGGTPMPTNRAGRSFRAALSVPSD